VLRVSTRVLLNVYARGARAHGVPSGRTSSVIMIQRAGPRFERKTTLSGVVIDPADLNLIRRAQMTR